MGYDIWATGEFNVGADKAADAIETLQMEIAANPQASKVTWKMKADPNDPVSQLDLYFQTGTIERGDDGSLTLHFGDDTIRHEEYDEWLFSAAAPFCDDGDIFFKGEDGYEWGWEIKDGVLSEVQSETVWGADTQAPAVVQKIVETLYPDGKSVVAQSLPAYEWEQLVTKIEAIVRENGFGPQAGMNELERMADV